MVRTRKSQDDVPRTDNLFSWDEETGHAPVPLSRGGSPDNQILLQPDLAKEPLIVHDSEQSSNSSSDLQVDKDFVGPQTQPVSGTAPDKSQSTEKVIPTEGLDDDKTGSPPVGAPTNAGQSLTQPVDVAADDSQVKTTDQLSLSIPERRLVRLDLIDPHPLLPGLYSRRGARYPPELTLEYLTPKGIRTAARFLPIHLAASGTRMQCFAGVRLWLTAQNTLGPEAEIEALVYSNVSGSLVDEAIEMELDIMLVWQRQEKKELEALDFRSINSSSPNGLRLKFDGTEQDKWRRILKISLKTLQNRVASLRK